jgi:hypothetical protein
MTVTPSTKDNGKSDSTNPYYDDTSAIVADIDSIRITEVEQPWRLGVMSQTPVYFTVQPVEIIVDGDERIWGTVEMGTNGTIGNGKVIEITYHITDVFGMTKDLTFYVQTLN